MVTADRPVSGSKIFLLLLGLLAAAWLPILSVGLPPLVDYPNHLARMAILADAGRTPFLASYYAVHWAPLPNLAMDAIVPVLASIVPLEWAGRVFLLTTVALLALGPVLLHRAVWGRWSAWPCLAGLLLYNRILLWGFVNYLFGLGLGFCVFALWVALAAWPWRRAAIMVPLALVLFFCHIAGFGVFALIAIGIEAPAALSALSRKLWGQTLRRICATALPFIAPAVVFLGFWSGSATGPSNHAHFWRKADLLFNVFDNYSRVFDGICFALFLALFAVPAIKRRLALAPSLVWPLLLLLAAYLALPSELMSGAGADHRLPLALFMLLIAATQPMALSGNLRRFLVIVPVAMFALRLAVIEHVWLAADRTYRADLAALDQVPQGARIAVAESAEAVAVTSAPTLHLATLAIIRRQAFVPTLFAYPAQQPVRLAAPWDTLAAATDPGALWNLGLPGPGIQPAVRLALRRYDYIVFVDRRPVAARHDPMLADLGGTPEFRLYRVIGAAGPVSSGSSAAAPHSAHDPS